MALVPRALARKLEDLGHDQWDWSLRPELPGLWGGQRWEVPTVTCAEEIFVCLSGEGVHMPGLGMGEGLSHLGVQSAMLGKALWGLCRRHWRPRGRWQGKPRRGEVAPLRMKLYFAP